MELPPAVPPERGGRPENEVAYRLRQQELLTEFGRFGLTCRGTDPLLQEAARLAARGLQTTFAKVLTPVKGEDRLLVRAGVGWREGVVGHATIGADLNSPAGYALHTGKPVLANHLADERRFRTPALLAEHGLTRALNVIINCADKPFGVLEVDSRQQGRFTEHDIAFLQGLANLLGVALERQAAEAARERLLRELSIERARFDAVLRQMPTGVAIASAPSGELLLHNDAAVRLIGHPMLSARDYTGYARYGAEHQDGRPYAAEDYPIARALRGETVQQEEMIYRRGDGTLTRFWVSAAPVRDADGRIVYAVSTFGDIAERKRLEEELRRLNETLERQVEERTAALHQALKMEALGRNTGTIAHDFNNILQAVIGNLEMLAARVEDAPSLAKYVAAAERAAARGERMAQDLLAFSRQQGGEARATDMNAVIGEMGDMLASLAGDGVELRTRLAPDLGRTLVDPSLLERAILNLVSNARDALPEGGAIVLETANVTLGPQDLAAPAEMAPGAFVRLTVRDTGIGIPPDARGKVFDPFFTTKPAGAGTGLGLSMVYGFARQAGGQVAIESAENAGTIVTLDLPRVA